MLELLFTFLSVFWPTNDALALQKTAPRCLTTERAKRHLAASYIASKRYGIDQDLILSVAFYESRYRANVVAKEPKGKFSCGVMTPVPTRDMARCRRHNASLLKGYFAGTKHLKEWFRVCRGSRRCALLGYNGGYVLLKACKLGPHYRTRGGKQVDICKNSEIRVTRAKTIRRTRKVFSGV